jgi:hypothetical protein
MAPTITVTIMASTGTTTKIRAGLAALAVFLGVSAAVNLCCTWTPVSKANTEIDGLLHALAAMSETENAEPYQDLLQRQEQALAAKPSEPYAWARLSYLRQKTGAGDRSAFEALRMADIVSPFEIQQLPERAVSWLKFREVENAGERAYQDALWQKSFSVASEMTWNLALHLGLIKYVGEALARKDKDLAEDWQLRMRDADMAP